MRPFATGVYDNDASLVMSYPAYYDKPLGQRLLIQGKITEEGGLILNEQQKVEFYGGSLASLRKFRLPSGTHLNLDIGFSQSMTEELIQKMRGVLEQGISLPLAQLLSSETLKQST